MTWVCQHLDRGLCNGANMTGNIPPIMHMTPFYITVINAMNNICSTLITVIVVFIHSSASNQGDLDFSQDNGGGGP